MINQLQLPSTQPFMTDLNLASSLSQLGQVYKQAQKEQKLSDLGKQLASGTVDYRAAAGQVADMGDVGNTLKFLELAEQQKKQADELAASREFNSSLSLMYGAQPGTAAAMPAAVSSSPLGGAPAQMAIQNAGASPVMANVDPGAPAVAPRAPVTPSAKVWGDKEAEAAGLYEPTAPVRVASATPTTMTDAGSGPAPNQSAGTTPVAQAVPSTQGTPAGLPSVSPRAIQLIAASGSSRLPQAQRDTAKVLLTSELDNSKATSEMKEWAFAKAQDPNTPDYTTWTRANKSAGKTEVNVDTKGANAFATAGGTAIAKRFEELSKEGDTATTDLAMIGQLRDLGAKVGSGAPAVAQKILADYGIKVGANVGAVEAYGAIIDKLTPQQRIPGSGATSDYEGKMFKNSLPTLMKTPEGNEIIQNTLAGLAQYKIDRARVAEQGLTGELSPKDTIKALRDLPSPYQNFQDFKKSGFKADPNSPQTASAPRAAAKLAPADVNQSLANAKAAIAANPSARDGIIKKLMDNGLDPSGL